MMRCGSSGICAGSSVTLGDDITVTVLEDPRPRVRLGIEAPAQVTVHRSELLERARASVTRTSFGAHGSSPPRPPTQQDGCSSAPSSIVRTSPIREAQCAYVGQTAKDLTRAGSCMLYWPVST